MNDIRPDAQAFDEIRIITEPRYKMSGLSGDEWRISARILLMRKGRVVAERSMGNVQWAVMGLGMFYLESQDNGLGYFASEGAFCDQEGCAQIATVKYRKLAHYDNAGNRSDCRHDTYRQFCEIHRQRGDCGLDDADSNYVLVEGLPRGGAGRVTR